MKLVAMSISFVREVPNKLRQHAPAGRWTHSVRRCAGRYALSDRTQAIYKDDKMTEKS